MRLMKNKSTAFIALIISMCLIGGCGNNISTTVSNEAINTENSVSNDASVVGGSAISTENTEESVDNQGKNSESDTGELLASHYNGKAWVEVNGNVPYFTENDITTNEFETYSDLDDLGRCGVTFANISDYTMPTEDRGEIGQVKPTGWHTVKYDCVDGKYLYNRCHLIGFQLAGENANEKNLITGTRYLNIDGMLDFENIVADYVRETHNHVMYRVTPIYSGNNIIAEGVLMEGYSVEDKGEGIEFCVFAYNVQPGVTIDYTTGESCLSGDVIESSEQTDVESEQTDVESEQTSNNDVETFVLNTNSKKFHREDCSTLARASENNLKTVEDNRDTIINDGYEPCKVCNP